MARSIQPSFAKGELAPFLHGRVDTAAYAVGLATARNMIIHTYGGASNRPGTTYLGPVADHGYAPWLFKFQFKTTDKYILEFGDQYMRVIRDGGHVVTGEKSITGATAADPVVITATAHGYSDNDEVYISGVGGMTQLNFNRYYIANKTTDTFELTNQITGVDIDGTGFGTYTSGGTVAKVYELATPYAIADVGEISIVQSADVLTLVHQDYAIYELSRLDHDDWTLTPVSFGPEIDTPADITVSVGTTGSVTDRYQVTAIDRETDEESLPGLNDTEKTITGATAADPVVITAASHGFSNGDRVQIDNVVGMTELNGQRYTVANKDTNTFELTNEDGEDIDGSAYTAYSSAGIARQTFVRVTNSVATKNNTIAWTAVAGASVYAVYRELNGIFGLIGETESVTFLDSNITPNTSIGPPRSRNPFFDDGDQPGAVGYYEQRRVFGGSLNKPDTSEFSQTGNHANFNRSRPTQDDDAISATLSSQQVNEIRWYVGLNDLVTFTSGSEWRINAGPDSLFSGETIRQRPQSSWGAARIQPIVAGNTILFVTEDQANVRSLGYSFQLDGYTGANMNLLSQHLLLGYQIVDWDYTRTPESRVYSIRDDGKMLPMSFDQEQEVIAWTHWDTDGHFERVATLQSGGSLNTRSPNLTHNEDTLYFVVKRTINGLTVRYIETWSQHEFDDVRDCFFLDSGLSYDEPVFISGITAADPVVVTATSHGFSDGDEVDLFDILWVPDISANFTSSQPDQLNRRRYTVANKTTHTFELNDEDGNNIDGTAFNAYVSGGTARKAVDTVAGFEHLEGETITILADGNVISNVVVTDATVTLPRKFSRIHGGLPYVSDLQTLNIESSDGTVQGLKTKISKLVIRFHKSRGMLFGPSEDNLTEMKQREFEAMGDPTSLLTGDKELIMPPAWKVNGRMFLRQKDPLPMTILAIIPEVDIGDR